MVFPVSLITPVGITQFRGFLIQARVPGTTVPIGIWEMTDSANQQLLLCSNTNDAVTHTNSMDKVKIDIVWIAPTSNPPSDVMFVY